MNWINIEEDFPDYYEHSSVIVYMPRAYNKIDVQSVSRKGNISENKSRFSKGWNKGEGIYEVTHWMPLPESPKKPC